MSNLPSVIQSPHLIMLQKNEKEVQLAMGKGGDAQRFCRVAMTEFRSNPKLAECSPESFMIAIYEAARLGLEVGKQLGQYYLIPRGREVVPMLGYRGMVALGLRHPEVQTISATPIYAGDFFQHGENMDGLYFDYKPQGNTNPLELEQAYAICRLMNKGVILEVMNRSQIEAARAKSMQGNTGPWRDWYSEMARKTVVRRLFKYIPMIAECATAIEKDAERWGLPIEQRDPSKYRAALEQAEKLRIEDISLEESPKRDIIDQKQGDNGGVSK